VFIEDPNGTGGNAGVLKNRLQVDSNTTPAETVAAENALKWSITTGKINLLTASGESALFIIEYTGTGRLIIPSNAFLAFNVVGAGSASDVGIVHVDANPQEGTGVFTALSTFNWDIGKSTTPNFTAKSGADGNTFTGATQTVEGFFELPVNVVANTEDFVMEQGTTFGISVTPPPGTTSLDGVLMMNVYEILS
jgi:hypothetical protein